MSTPSPQKASGLLPFLDPETLRFPDEFAPPSVSIDAAAAVQAKVDAQQASTDAQAVATGLPAQATAAVTAEVVAQVDPKVVAAQSAQSGAVTARNEAVQARVDAVAAKTAAEAVGATNDTIMAAKASDPASAFAGVLSAAFRPQDSIDSVIAKLDMRDNTGLVIAQASDSTGDAANEWFELAWQESFASLWKERPVRVCRWFDPGAGGSYQPWETWQTGDFSGSTEITTVFRDSFTADKPAIIGTSPEVGAIWTQFNTHSPYWSTSGGKLVRGGANDGIRATLRGDLNARVGSDFTFTGKVQTTVPTTVETEMMVVSNTESVARVYIVLKADGSATLSKYYDSTVTVLGTFPVGTSVNATEMSFELSLSGTTLTGKLNGATLTTTLTSGEVTTLGTLTRIVVRSQLPDTAFDDFLVTAVATLPPVAATEPRIDVYNGGAAGKTADYQRANLNAMYPVRPDILFINHGHNYLAAVTVTTMLASIQGLVDDLNALYPGNPIPIAITSQNPQFGSGREGDHKAKMMAVRDYALKKGWGYIPTFEAFTVRPGGGADQMLDALHPGIGTGRRVQADVAKAWLKTRSRRPTV